MSIVVGCPSCGQISQVPTERACARCRVPRVVLLTVDENIERWSRGVSVDAWFAAPKTPANRSECEDNARPCPHLRCRYQLGRPGAFGCSLDVADNGVHSQARVGELLGLEESRAGDLEQEALRNARTLGPTVLDEWLRRRVAI